MSPVFFNLYIDDLSKSLTDWRVGCTINSRVINHLFYADDAVLLAPSPDALKQLLKICENYACETSILYNVKKSVCMYIKTKRWSDLPPQQFVLCGKILENVKEYKYLGVFICDSTSDDRDIKRQLCAIYGRGNLLIRKFGKCSDSVKHNLFRAYLCNFYCCHLWRNYTDVAMKRVRVAFNNVFRSLMRIKGKCSISQLYVMSGIDSFPVLKRKSIVNFRTRVLASQNTYISAVSQSLYFIQSSKLCKEWLKHCF